MATAYPGRHRVSKVEHSFEFWWAWATCALIVLIVGLPALMRLVEGQFA